MINTLLLIIVIICLALGQVLFKRAGLTMQGQPIPGAFLTLATQPGFYLALAIYGFATLLWTWVLSRLPLSQAYPWVAVTSVIVPLLGWLAFGERLTLLFWIGMGFILIGLLLTQQATAP